MRVAMGLALEEKDGNTAAIEFYRLLSSFDFMSSTPTLFNSGTLRAPVVELLSHHRFRTICTKSSRRFATMPCFLNLLVALATIGLHSEPWPPVFKAPTENLWAWSPFSMLRTLPRLPSIKEENAKVRYAPISKHASRH